MCIVTLSCGEIRNCERNPQILVESANCKWNWQIVSGIRIFFADSTYILRIPLTFCGIHLPLRNPEQLAIFACSGIRNKTNVPTNFTLELFKRGIHETFATCLKICLWNPGTYRHKIVRLSSAQLGLVMNLFLK